MIENLRLGNGCNPVDSVNAEGKQDIAKHLQQHVNKISAAAKRIVIKTINPNYRETCVGHPHIPYFPRFWGCLERFGTFDPFDEEIVMVPPSTNNNGNSALKRKNINDSPSNEEIDLTALASDDESCESDNKCPKPTQVTSLEQIVETNDETNDNTNKKMRRIEKKDEEEDEDEEDEEEVWMLSNWKPNEAPAENPALAAGDEIYYYNAVFTCGDPRGERTTFVTNVDLHPEDSNPNVHNFVTVANAEVLPNTQLLKRISTMTDGVRVTLEGACFISLRKYNLKAGKLNNDMRREMGIFIESERTVDVIKKNLEGFKKKIGLEKNEECSLLTKFAYEKKGGR